MACWDEHVAPNPNQPNIGGLCSLESLVTRSAPTPEVLDLHSWKSSSSWTFADVFRVNQKANCKWAIYNSKMLRSQKPLSAPTRAVVPEPRTGEPSDSLHEFSSTAPGRTCTIKGFDQFGTGLPRTQPELHRCTTRYEHNTTANIHMFRIYEFRLKHRYIENYR
jgi:hypothetical protein